VKIVSCCRYYNMTRLRHNPVIGFWLPLLSPSPRSALNFLVSSKPCMPYHGFFFWLYYGIAPSGCTTNLFCTRNLLITIRPAMMQMPHPTNSPLHPSTERDQKEKEKEADKDNPLYMRLSQPSQTPRREKITHTPQLAVYEH
jgi:hypothetical protein